MGIFILSSNFTIKSSKENRLVKLYLKLQEGQKSSSRPQTSSFTTGDSRSERRGSDSSVVQIPVKHHTDSERSRPAVPLVSA